MKTIKTALAALAFLCLGFVAQGQRQYIPELPVDPSSFTTEEVHFTSDGKDIFGMAFVPKGELASKKMPAVIMAHGYNGNPVVYHELVDRLVRKGFICYFFDFCGGSTRHRSEGEITDMSLLTEEKNLEDAIAMVRSWKNVDKKRLFLVGESQGGIVAALTAADNARKVKAIALMYPAFCIPYDARRAFKSKGEIPQTFFFLSMTVGRKYYEDVYDMDVYRKIAKYRKPVLIVHGDSDTLVPIQYSEKAMEFYKDARMEVIPGAPHGFIVPQFSHANVDYIDEFFCSEAF